MRALPVDDWMHEREMSVGDLLRATGLEKKVVEAIAGGRWTPTIEQRRRIAGALGVSLEEVFWGHTCQVEHVYGTTAVRPQSVRLTPGLLLTFNQAAGSVSDRRKAPQVRLMRNAPIEQEYRPWHFAPVAHAPGEPG